MIDYTKYRGSADTDSSKTKSGDTHSKKHTEKKDIGKHSKDHNEVKKWEGLQEFMDNQYLNLGIGIAICALLSLPIGFWIMNKLTEGRSIDEGDMGTIFIVVCFLIPFAIFFGLGLHSDENVRHEYQVKFLKKKTGVIVGSGLKWLPGLALGFPFGLDKAEHTTTEVTKVTTKFKMRDKTREWEIGVYHSIEATDSDKVANRKAEDVTEYVQQVTESFFSDHFKPFDLTADLEKSSGIRNWSKYITNDKEHIEDIGAFGYSIIGRVSVVIRQTDAATDNKAGIFWKRVDELKSRTKNMSDSEIIKSAMQLSGLTSGFAFFGEGTDAFIQGKAMDHKLHG